VRCAGVIVALLASVSVLVARSPQTSTSARPTFEVVSIKRNETGGNLGGIRPQPSGRFVMANAPIGRLIRAAYPTVASQLIGAPSWVDSERYDIEARAEGNPTASVMEAMLRALLVDRFQLVAHVEPREQDVYGLYLASGDGRLGPALRAAALDCVELVEKHPAGALTLPPRANGAPACGIVSDGRRLSSGGITMAQLIRSISPMVGRVVVDRTSLDGYYEFTLEYAARPGNAAGVTDPADDRPSIFTALQEQLGLTLRSERAPVDVLVIDRLERPTSN
jgi:uncharacterized protein (TIGR03435 family)